MRVFIILLILSTTATAVAQEVADGAAQATEASPAPESSFDLVAVIADGPPLSADEAAAQAVIASPSLARSRALTTAAEAGVARARAQMLPRLELSANYVHIDGFDDGAIPMQADPAAIAAQRTLAGRVADPAAQALFNAQISGLEAGNGVSIEVPRDRINFGARLTWAASDFFFAMMPAVDSAEHLTEVRVHELAAAEAGVKRSAYEAYLNLVRARGAHGVAVAAQGQAEARLEEVAAGARAGFLTEADELAAASQVAEAVQGVATATAGVEIADAGLRTVIGADDGPIYGVRLEGRREATAVDYAGALERRPELRALRAALSAQRSAQNANDASGYPHLALFAGADYANPNRYQVPPSSGFMPSWEIGASVSWSPNDAVVAGRQGAQLTAEATANEAQLLSMERMIRLEVRQAEAQLRAAERGIEASNSAIRAAEAAYQSRLSQLRAGEATTAALNDSERQLNRARLGLLDARVQLELAAVHLAYAGGLL